MSQLLHRCMTKATIAEGDDIRHSLNWLVSRRGILKVYDDRLECGDWDIPYSDIEEAVLFQTRQMFIPCYVLRVRTNNRIYQFGLNPGKYWASELPFPVRRESAKLAFSWFSLVIRMGTLAAIVFWIWSRFLRGG